MMVRVLELREKIKILYSQYDRYLFMIGKFLLALIGLIYLSFLGDGWGIKAALPMATCVIGAVVCAFLPAGTVSVVYCIVILLQTAQLSMEPFLLAAIQFVLMLLLYFSFRPHNSVWLAIALLLYLLEIPQLAFLCVGMFCTSYTLLPVCFGIVTGYYLRYLSTSLSILAQSESGFSMEVFLQLLTGMFGEQRFYLVLLAAVLTTMVVYVLRRTSMQYARYVAVFSGGVVYLLVRLLCLIVLKQSFVILGELVITILIMGLVLTLVRVVCVEDYSRVEYTQFEDEEYHYYVKAVPKMTVTLSDTKVKTYSAPVRNEDMEKTRNL